MRAAIQTLGVMALAAVLGAQSAGQPAEGSRPVPVIAWSFDSPGLGLEGPQASAPSPPGIFGRALFDVAVDPPDDCTIWYGGDYLKKDAASCSTRIGAFQLPG